MHSTIHDFTDEQQQAITTFNRNLIVTAGAGSGKTRVLVERFMALLDHHTDWELTDVVAITFTEKAAREMRDRVRAEITQRIREDSSVEHWRRHEAALDSARISTIHSLCVQLLRANSVEARLDPGFEVIDEIEARLLQREAVEQTLVELLETDDRSARLMLTYSMRDLRENLLRYTAYGQGDEFLEEPVEVDQLFQRWLALWEDDSQQAILNLKQNQDFLDALAWIDSFPQPYPTGDKLWPAWQTVLDYRDAILSEESAPAIYEALQIMASEITLQGGTAGNWGSKNNVQDSKAALRFIRETAADMLKNYLLPRPGEMDEQAAYLITLWQRAVQALRQTYTRLKMLRNVLDFDDLEYETMLMLDNHPAVARRYSDPEWGEFKHIMVDEFQDTNEAQRRIIYALCGIQEDTAPPGRLFVVGDPKQSIYAFRGADVSVFNDVRHEILHTGGVEVPLSMSFRTHQRLVHMFNGIFDSLLQVESGPMEKYAVPFDRPMMAFRESQDSNTAPLALMLLKKLDQDPDEKLKATDYRRWEAYEIAQHIHAMVEAETLIWDKAIRAYRPMTYGDVVLLFQSRSHVELYENTFQAQDLPYITVGGTGYYNQQEIWDLMNLLRTLHNPSDNLSLASVLRSSMLGISDDGLFALRRREREGKRLNLWEAVFAEDDPEQFIFSEQDQSVLKLARTVLEKLHALSGRVTVADLLMRALEMTAFEATLMALPGGERRRANVMKLLEVARQSQRVSLGEFITYLNDVRTGEAREGEAALDVEGVVTLMTVHASKGLEFPVVILPDSSWSRRGSLNDLFTVDPVAGMACRVPVISTEQPEKPFVYRLAERYGEQREAMERRRLLYVAATRAGDYLIVSGQEDNRPGTWLTQLRDVLELDGDLESTAGFEHHTVPQGTLNLQVVDIPPDLHSSSVMQPQHGNWDDLMATGTAIHSDQVLDYIPLMRPLNVHIPGIVRHINATRLEKLGQAKFERPQDRGYLSFRQMVLRDMPPSVKPLIHDGQEKSVPPYVVGNIVHRTLKVGLSIKSADLDEALRAYAWEYEVTSEPHLEYTLDKARQLLAKYAESPIPAMLQKADQLYREIPFVYERGPYIIHGIIDVLYYYNNQWYVLDYKTTAIPENGISRHARRYTYQMGAYAMAVEERIWQTPIVLLYYLHPGRQWEVLEKDWRTAIDNLGIEITTALENSTG